MAVRALEWSFGMARINALAFVRTLGVLMPTYSEPPEGSDSPDGPDDAAVQRVLREVPKGAFALAGVAMGLLLLAWLFVYFCVFLPRGPVS